MLSEYEPINICMKEHEYALSSLDLGIFLRNVLCDFIEDNSSYKGYMEGGQDACNSFLKQLKHLGYRFSVRNSVSKQIEIQNNIRLFFTNSRGKINIEMFGPPFCVAKYYNMVCIKGNPRLNKLKNQKISNKKSKKKIGCPAELHIKIIKYFPKYAVNKDAKLAEKLKVMCHLKSNISNPNFVIEHCERLYINLSKDIIHKHQPIFTINTNERINDKDITVLELETENDILKNDLHIKLLEKRNHLKSLLEDIKMVSNHIVDEELLDKGIQQMSELLNELSKSDDR